MDYREEIDVTMWGKANQLKLHVDPATQSDEFSATLKSVVTINSTGELIPENEECVVDYRLFNGVNAEMAVA